jgi:NADH-quinone oxidoreductase subunit M
MPWLADHLLTIAIFLPLAGAVIIAFLDRQRPGPIRWVALLASLLTFLVTVVLYVRLRPDTPGMQFVEVHPWIASPPVDYHLGVDGLSALLILLTGFLTPLCVLVSWTGITQRVKEFFIFLLALETGMIGVFASLDLVLFFVFWEVMLIPMYFLIGIWGHERRIYAAVKFILYTMAGSALMLVGILYLYNRTGTFDLLRIVGELTSRPLLSPGVERWLFLAFFVAFAIKVPLFPFHTWLPDAHVEAPTAGSVILAGVLLKMGTYGMLRFCLPLFPRASREFAPMIIILAIIGIIYGALVAMVQPDLKKLVAYSSVAHLGFCVLGIFVFNIQGMEGSIYQMFSHGVSTGALFILVGLLYERRHTRLISEFGGLATSLPVYSTFFLIVTLSSLGLPMLNGFVGEFLIILGSYHSRAVYAALAAVGVVLAAVYLLWMYQRVFYGEITNDKNKSLPDCSALEKLILTTVVIVILGMGIYPQPFLRRMDPSVDAILPEFRSRGVEESRSRGVEESTSRGVEESRIRGVEESRSRGVEESRIRGVEESRSRGVEESGSRGAEKRELGTQGRKLGTESERKRSSPSPTGRGWTAAGAFISRRGPGEGSLADRRGNVASLSPDTTYDIPHTALLPVPYSLFPIPSTGGGQ